MTSALRRPAICFLSLVLVLACSDSPTGRPGEPAQVDKVSGDEQIGTVGEELDNPLVVKILDERGRPVGNQLVNFRVVAGGGSVFAGSALTDAQGVAQERWTLGTSSQDEQRVEARAVNAQTGQGIVFATFTATPRAGAVATLEVTAGANQGALAGTALPVAPSVRARDAFGNVVPNATVTFAVATGGGTIANGVATTGTNGIATAGTWTLGMGSGGQTLSVTSGTAPAATISAMARSRAPAQLTIVQGGAGIAAVASAVETPPRVLVRNADGDALPGIAVTFTPLAGSGTVTGTPATTDSQGHATVGSWTLGTTAGTQSLTVAAGDMSLVVTATATAGAPAALALTAAPPATAEVGSVVSFTVRATDQFGNVLSGVALAAEVTAGAGSISSATVTTSADGFGTFTWTLGTAVGPNSVRVRAGSGPSITTDVASRPGAAAVLDKHSGEDQEATVGTAVGVPPSVVVTDRFGNPVPNVPVSFAVGSGGGTAGTTAMTGSDGIAATSGWTLGTAAGANTLSASAPGTNVVTFTASALAGPPASLAKLAGDAESVAPGATVSPAPTVRITDAYGNPVAGVGVTFAVAAGGGTITGGAATTNSAGGASVGSWTVGATGPQQLTATVSGLPPVTFTAALQAAVASSLAPLPSNPTAAAYGDHLRPGVIVFDQYGGPLAGIPVTFSVPDGSGMVRGENSVATDANGVALAGEWMVSSCTGFSTLRATAAGIPTPLDISIPVSTDVPMVVTLQLDGTTLPDFSVGGRIGRPTATVHRACTSEAMNGVEVTFTLTVGQSFLDAYVVTTSLGSARPGDWRAACTIGTTTIAATVVGPRGLPITGTLSSTVYPGQPSRLVKLTGDNQIGVAESTLPIVPSLRVEDSCGNPAPNHLGNFGLPGTPVDVEFLGLSGGQGTALFRANAQGVVTASPWTLSPIVGTQSLFARVAGPSTPSATFQAQAIPRP